MALNTFTSSPPNGTLSGGGMQLVQVGATLTVGNGQPAGNYAGTFSITVNYRRGNPPTMAYIAAAKNMPMPSSIFPRLRARLWIGAPPPCCSRHPSARADLMLFPTRIVFEKTQRAAQLELINQGKTPETYRLSLVNRRMNETGEFAPAETPEPGELFADEMVRSSPRQVTIAPGSSQTVRMLLRKPENLAAGEYRSHLQIDRVPDPVGSGSLEAARDNGNIGVTLTALVGASIPVIVRQGDIPCATVALTQLALLPAGAEPASIAFEIDRSGDRSVYGDLTVTFVPKSGAPIEVAKAGGVAVYEPNALRRARMPLRTPDGTVLSGGTLRDSFRERADTGGKLLAEASLAIP